jgi:hypothetical protein
VKAVSYCSGHAELASARLANNYVKNHSCGDGIAAGCIAAGSTVSGHIDRPATAGPK